MGAKIKTTKKNTIIVADDDPAILEAVKMILELHNYEVMTISDGLVLQKLKGSLPGLLLLDVLMSGVDGRDICKQLKSRQDTKNIPVILISASHDIAPSIKAAGANDFLPKPFDIDDLLNKVAKYISN